MGNVVSKNQRHLFEGILRIKKFLKAGFCVSLIMWNLLLPVGCFPPIILTQPHIHKLAEPTQFGVNPSSACITAEGYGKSQTQAVDSIYVYPYELQYSIEFATANELDDSNPEEKIMSNERWIPYNSGDISRCGPFRVRFSHYLSNTDRNVAICPYLDPCEPNLGSGLQFCAVFDTPDGVSVTEGAEVYLYIGYNNNVTCYTLFCRIKAVDGKDETTDLFLIADNGGLWIGDDFILDFKVRNTGFADTHSRDGFGDINSSINFFAIYDKTLLDYAKKYCNNAYSQENNPDGIYSWTKFNDNAIVTGSVAYGWGGTDDIESFNMKLIAQRNAIRAYYSNDTYIPPNPLPSLWRYLSSWQYTTAPDNYWFFYLDPPGDFSNGIVYEPVRLGGMEYYPYIPGFSTYRRIILDNYYWQHVLYSAGVDCSGFIQRVASYAGNPYKLEDLSGTDTWFDRGDLPVHSKKSVADLADVSRSRSIIYTNSLVPGDIVISVAADHVAMISKIDYPDNVRSVENKKNIILLEAARGSSDEWRVINKRTWLDLSDYVARRLAIE